MTQLELFQTPAVTFDIQGSFLLILERDSLGPQRRIQELSKIELSALSQSDQKALKDKLTVLARVYDFPELKSIQSLDSQITSKIKKVALPSLFKFGAYLIPLPLFTRVDTMLQDYVKNREALIQILIDRYEERLIDIKLLMGSYADKVQWIDPMDLPGWFSCSYRFCTLGLPKELEALDPLIFEREKALALKAIKEQEQLILEALTSGFRQVVSTFAARLQPKADGTRWLIKDAVFNNLKEFLELLPQRMLVQNEELADLAVQAKALLSGVSPDILRDNLTLQESMAQAFEPIVTSVDSLTQKVSGRKISFDE